MALFSVEVSGKEYEVLNRIPTTPPSGGGSGSHPGNSGGNGWINPGGGSGGVTVIPTPGTPSPSPKPTPSKEEKNPDSKDPSATKQTPEPQTPNPQGGYGTGNGSPGVPNNQGHLDPALDPDNPYVLGRYEQGRWIPGRPGAWSLLALTGAPVMVPIVGTILLIGLGGGIFFIIRRGRKKPNRDQ